MPEIEITEDQRDRLRAVQESLEADVVGKYGHVRASDALEYLLDRYEADAAGASDGGDGVAGDDAASDGDDADGDPGDGADGEDDAASGGDDDTLDAMMNLLDEHDDRWEESSSGEERYEVELPDGSTEGARTKDDVRGLLFEHYR